MTPSVALKKAMLLTQTFPLREMKSVRLMLSLSSPTMLSFGLPDAVIMSYI